MEFDEVRVGDTVRTRAEYADGTVVEAEFTVKYASGRYKYFGNSYYSVHADRDYREPPSIELVHRKPEVGDRLTGAQVQALPDHAVFLSYQGVPRTVFNGMSYAPGLVETSLRHHDIPDPAYRLIYLPEEGDSK